MLKGFVLIVFLLVTNVNASEKIIVFHIISKSDWQNVSKQKLYEPTSLKSDGFIHLSKKEQVVETANLFFKGRKDLLLLRIEIPSSDKNLKWEKATGADRNDLFPHYYAPLSIDKITSTIPLEPTSTGTFTFPNFRNQE